MFMLFYLPLSLSLSFFFIFFLFFNITFSVHVPKLYASMLYGKDINLRYQCCIQWSSCNGLMFYYLWYKNSISSFFLKPNTHISDITHISHTHIWYPEESMQTCFIYIIKQFSVADKNFSLFFHGNKIHPTHNMYDDIIK